MRDGTAAFTGKVARNPVARNPVARPRFVAWDGEAIHHRYCLLANSTGATIEADARLSTLECLHFLTPLTAPSTNVWFNFNYDVNQIVWDFERAMRDEFFAGHPVIYQGFELQYFKRKILIIRYRGRQWKHYDVFGFFQASFLKVVKQMIGEVPAILDSGKSRRASFSRRDRDFIRRYNATECSLLVEVMDLLADALRIEVLDKPIKMSSWHGAGAVAGAVLSRIPSVKANVQLRDDLPVGLMQAASRAYYGGRIELLKIGRVGACYGYDINSAYPAAMTRLPDMRGAVVETHTPKRAARAIDNPAYTGLVKVRWDSRFDADSERAGGLPWRARDGSILFPALGMGWYWAHEVRRALDTPIGKSLAVLDSYTWRYRPCDEFAGVVSHMYEDRKRLKRAGDLRQLGLKLGLNSLYGKLAQVVGKRRWYFPLWAGYITSYTRAMLLDAYALNPEAIVGFATDSIYSTAPLDLPENDQLGGWSGEAYSDSVFVMPGLALLSKAGKTTEAKVRGFSGISLTDAIAQIDAKGYARLSVQMFVGHTLADRMPDKFGAYRCFVVGQHESTCNVKELHPYQTQKRRYDFAGGGAGGKMSSTVWGSQMPLLKGEAHGGIIESYPMLKLKKIGLIDDKDLA